MDFTRVASLVDFLFIFFPLLSRFMPAFASQNEDGSMDHGTAGHAVENQQPSFVPGFSTFDSFRELSLAS